MDTKLKMMKNKIYLLLCMAVSLLCFSSCVDDLTPPPVGGSAPSPNTLSSNLTGSTFILMQEDSDLEFGNFTWGSVNFNSDVEVKYTLEVDVVGNNFSNASIITTTADLSKSLTVGEMNQALIFLGLNPGDATDVEIRVRSWIDFLHEPALSNSISLTLTSYELVFPPIYIVGDAQGWNLGNAAELTSNTPGVYQGVARFQTNGNFRFFEIPDWGATQWGYSTFVGGTIASELTDAEDGDSNFKFVGATTDYQITVSFPAKSISIVPLGPAYPSALYLVTSKLVDIATAIEIPTIDAGVYEEVVWLEEDCKFRFFNAKLWGAEKFNVDYFEGILHSELTDSGDDVGNLLFTGTAGYYKITISLPDLSVDLTPSSPTLFIIGDDQSWNLGNAFALNWDGDNTFSGTTTFTNGAYFRFFKEADWGATQYGYSFFTTIDPELLDGGGGDSNFIFNGTTGIHTITIDLDAGTVQIN